MEIDKLTEITHPLLLHKHNNHCSGTRIDKVFTNVATVSIVEVFPSCENISQSTPINNLEWTGHRPYLISIGSVEKSTDEFKVTCSNSVQKLGKLWLKMPMFDQNFPQTELGLTMMVDLLIDKTVEIIERSSKMVKNRVKSGNQLAIELMEGYTTEDLKNPIPSKEFYKFMNLFRSGTGETSCKDEPELKQFVNFASNKLSELNRPNSTKLKQVCFELWGNNREKIHFNFPDYPEFRIAILSTSNSNAKDRYGVSLKIAKMIMGLLGDKFKHQIMKMKHFPF